MTNKSKKRNIILTFVVLLLIFSITAVLIIVFLNMQKKPAKSTPTLSADEVVTGVIKKMNYSNLTPISTENITRYYEIPQGSVSDYAMYISGKSGTDIEITCFKVVEDIEQQPLLSAVNIYLNEKSNTSQNTAQPFNSKIATHFPYVFVAVAQDSDTAAKAFETVLNESLKDSNANSQ